MTETTPPPLPDPHDNVVEQAVERAAVKVAAAATTPTANGHPVLTKLESIAAVGIIVIVSLMNLAVNLVTKNDLHEHKVDFKAVCEIIVQQAPPETAKDLAIKLSECLK